MRIGRHASAVGRELDEHGFGEPHLIGLQARQSVGKDLGQHRDHAVGQINARRAIQRLAIQRRARPHEVRHVGNMHAQLPMPVRQPHQRDRIVEIAGIDRIDRDHGFAGQIDSRRMDRFVEPIGLIASVFEHVVGKMLRQVVFADDRKRIDARLAAAAEHFGDHAFAVVYVRRKADHLEHDFVVGPGVLRAGSPNNTGRLNTVPSTCTKALPADSK